MHPQGLDLPLHERGDVDRCVGVLRSGDVHLADLVRHQPFLLDQFGEERSRAGGGKDGVEGGMPCGPMIRMVDVGAAWIEVGRIAGDDHVRPRLAKHPHDVLAEGQVRHEVAVRVIQELHLPHAEVPRRVALLDLPLAGDGFDVGARLIGALIAAGQQTVANLAALVAPASDGAAAVELGVVRVRQDDQDALGARQDSFSEADFPQSQPPFS